MNATELRALQAPLKDMYKRGIGEGIACRVDTGRALIEAGLHPASGGTGLQACSGDMRRRASRFPTAARVEAARPRRSAVPAYGRR